jgi:ribulose 1,5-bisphosphate synthetase/thiazole synthase
MVVDGNAKTMNVIAEAGVDGKSRTDGAVADIGVEAQDVPVLVVGGGPSGLLLAYLLSKLGGKCS